MGFSRARGGKKLEKGGGGAAVAFLYTSRPGW